MSTATSDDVYAGPTEAPRVTMRTASGTYVNLIDPQVETIHIGDIAHQLSQINRFNGATVTPYSVAEHSIIVSRLVERRTGNTALALAGLLHDAPEAYVNDLNGLLKREPELAGFNEIEGRWARAIVERFELAFTLEEAAIKQADKDAFEFECAAIRDAHYRIAPQPTEVRREFLSRFYTLLPAGW
jgi:hypothetical protein